VEEPADVERDRHVVRHAHVHPCSGVGARPPLFSVASSTCATFFSTTSRRPSAEPFTWIASGMRRSRNGVQSIPAIRSPRSWSECARRWRARATSATAYGACGRARVPPRAVLEAHRRRAPSPLPIELARHDGLETGRCHEEPAGHGEG
jgi:hypothetical protein